MKFIAVISKRELGNRALQRTAPNKVYVTKTLKNGKIEIIWKNLTDVEINYLILMVFKGKKDRIRNL